MLCRYRNIYVLLPAVLTLVMMTSGCGLTDSEKQRDTPGPDPEVFPTDRTPAWSPSGDRIAYHHDAGGTEDSTDVSGLYVLDLDTDETRLLVEGSARSPDWRPDGERIAFSTGNIYTIQADGSDLKRVTEFGSSFRPRWSPDGKTISFGRSGSTNEVGVWFAHLRDSSFTRFGWVASPADWSPDGARIVYQNADQLWIGDTSRTDSTQLTENDYVANNDPAWSPNGEWIAWSPSTDDGLAVSVMRADGSNKKRLVEAPAAEPVLGAGFGAPRVHKAGSRNRSHGPLDDSPQRIGSAAGHHSFSQSSELTAFRRPEADVLSP